MDLGVDDNEAVRWAARIGHTDIVKILCSLPLERGVNPGANDNEAVRMAVRNGHTDIVKVLCSLPLERGVKSDLCTARK